MLSPKALITVYQSGDYLRGTRIIIIARHLAIAFIIPTSCLYDGIRTKAAYRSDVCIDWMTTTTEGWSNEPNSTVSNYYYFIMFVIYSVHEIILGVSSDKRALSCMHSTYICFTDIYIYCIRIKHGVSLCLFPSIIIIITTFKQY